MENKRVRKIWSIEEDNYIKANWNTSTIDDIANDLGRSFASVKGRAYNVLKLKGPNGRDRRIWTEEEDNYLKDTWGKYKVSTISRKINRTKYSIITRAIILNLGPQTQWYTTGEIQEMTGIDRTSIVKIIKRHDLKYCKDTTNKTRYQMNDDQIKALLEVVPNSWNYYNLTVDLWGKKKPEWLRFKIEADKNKSRKTNKYWTEKEDFILLDRIRNNCSIDRISLETGRDIASIKYRLRYKYNIKL